MGDLFVNNSGTNKLVESMSAFDGSQWKEISDAFVFVNGNWESFYATFDSFYSIDSLNYVVKYSRDKKVEWRVRLTTDSQMDSQTILVNKLGNIFCTVRSYTISSGLQATYLYVLDKNGKVLTNGYYLKATNTSDFIKPLAVDSNNVLYYGDTGNCIRATTTSYPQRELWKYTNYTGGFSSPSAALLDETEENIYVAFSRYNTSIYPLFKFTRSGNLVWKSDDAYNMYGTSSMLTMKGANPLLSAPNGYAEFSAIDGKLIKSATPSSFVYAYGLKDGSYYTLSTATKTLSRYDKNFNLIWTLMNTDMNIPPYIDKNGNVYGIINNNSENRKVLKVSSTGDSRVFFDMNSTAVVSEKMRGFALMDKNS